MFKLNKKELFKQDAAEVFEYKNKLILIELQDDQAIAMCIQYGVDPEKVKWDDTEVNNILDYYNKNGIISLVQSHYLKTGEVLTSFIPEYTKPEVPQMQYIDFRGNNITEDWVGNIDYGYVPPSNFYTGTPPGLG